MSDSRHVAGSGAKKGQWVHCPAENKCKLGGLHVSEKSFHAAQMWLKDKGEKKNLSQINHDDIKTFLEQPNVGEWQAKYVKKAAEDQVRFGENQRKRDEQAATIRRIKSIGKASKSSSTRKTKTPVVPQITENKTMVYEQASFNKHDYLMLKNQCEEAGVVLSHKGGTSKLYSDVKVLTLDNVKFTGPKDKVAQMISIADQYQTRRIRENTFTDFKSTRGFWNRMTDLATSRNVGIEFDRGQTSSFFGFGATIHINELTFYGHKEDVDAMTNWLYNNSN